MIIDKRYKTMFGSVAISPSCNCVLFNWWRNDNTFGQLRSVACVCVSCLHLSAPCMHAECDVTLGSPSSPPGAVATQGSSPTVAGPADCRAGGTAGLTHITAGGAAASSEARTRVSTQGRGGSSPWRWRRRRGWWLGDITSRRKAAVAEQITSSGRLFYALFTASHLAFYRQLEAPLMGFLATFVLFAWWPKYQISSAHLFGIKLSNESFTAINNKLVTAISHLNKFRNGS
jgi:hypothetical protein